MKEQTNAAEIQQEDQENNALEKKVNYWKYAKPVVLLVIGFIGGMAYAKSQKPTFNKKNQNQGKTWNNNQAQKPILKQKPVGDVNEVK